MKTPQMGISTALFRVTCVVTHRASAQETAPDPTMRTALTSLGLKYTVASCGIPQNRYIFSPFQSKASSREV